MEKQDKIIAVVIAFFVFVFSYYFELDYSLIAESGLTLSSIVLAVYVSVITGLVGSNLAAKLAKSIASKEKSRSQLGVLTGYFRCAIIFAVLTIVLSTFSLLLEYKWEEAITLNYLNISVLTIFNSLCLTVYAENVSFLIFVIRFMLNRQIWDR